MSLATPDLAELVQLAIASSLADAHTAMPGQIVAVYTDANGRGQSADVRPSLRNTLPTADNVEGFEPYAEEDLPVILRVPIAYPQGGGFAITWPLATGDFVLLVFAERSIDQWLSVASKSRQVAISTGDLGTHTLDGAIALPLGPAPYGHLLSTVPTDAIKLGSDTGKAIYVTATAVNLGSATPTDHVALASKVETELARIAADLSRLTIATETAIGAVPGGGPAKTAFALAVGSTALPATKVPSNPAPVGSSVVGSD
jgi:hypothetical protein